MMPKDRPLVWFLCLLLLAIQGCVLYSNSNEECVSVWQYKVVDHFPHDPNAFTQGLVWEDGFLYEGTGLYGRSSLRKVALETGVPLKKINLSDIYFGEGITIFEDKIYQLTWKEQTGFIYDLDTFQLLDTFAYPYEGWGITHDKEYLIISDGTSILHYLDPDTLEEVKQIEVKEDQTAIDMINELEYIQDKIYANIWQTDRIAIIEPLTGKVTAWLDLVGILDGTEITQKVDVLNGIAYHAKENRLFVTGKLWPKIFEIEIVKNNP